MDTVVDSSVVAKWVLPEADSPRSQQLMNDVLATGGRLIVLDLVFPEVANAIWKRQRQRLITPDEAGRLCEALTRMPVHIVPATTLLARAFEIAVRYDRAVYDALFVALSADLRTRGVTADEPLFNAVHADSPQIVLLRNL